MSRPGLPVGADAATFALLDFRHHRPASWVDDSPAGETLTVDGGDGSGFPRTCRGPFGWAARFGDPNHTNTDAFVSFTPTTPPTSALTIEYWVRYADDTTQALTMVSCIDGTGTGNADGLTYDDAWALSIAQVASDHHLRFSVWNDTNSSVVNCEAAMVSTGIGKSGRWVNLRGVYVANDYIALYADGVILAYEEHSQGNIASSNIDVIRIGSPWQSGSGARTTGDVANVRLRSVADSDPLTMSARLGERVTRRNWVTVDIDLGERLEGETWTDAGSSHYLTSGDFDLYGFAYDEDDIVGVTTVTAGVEAELTEVGNATDVDATDDSWWFNQQNGRLYLRAGANTDPGTLDLVRLRVRYRCAPRGFWSGGRVYAGSILNAELPTRAMPVFDEAFPTFTSPVELAQQHPSHPAGWDKEEATAIMWRGAPARARWASDYLTWPAGAPVLFRGFVDAAPEGDEDRITAHLVHDAGRLHRIGVSSLKANITDYPNLHEDYHGHVFPVCIGFGHLRVPCCPIDVSSSPYQFKVTAHALARITRAYLGDSGTLAMTDIDLDAGTFKVSVPLERVSEVTVDCDGFGDPTTATAAGPVYEFGDVSDTYLTPHDIIRGLLQTFAGVPAADLTDSSWTATDARVQTYLRGRRTLGSPGDFIEVLRALCPQSLAYLFPLAAGGWGWRDVRKADSVDVTLTDADIVELELVPDTSRLAERAQASASIALRAPTGRVTGEEKEQEALVLLGGFRYGSEATWEPVGDPTWFYEANAAAAWLAKVRGLLEGPVGHLRGRATVRLIEGECMDVVADNSAGAGVAGTRYRIDSVTPSLDGTVEFAAQPEGPYPADGTSTNSGLRDGLEYLSQMSYQVAAGTAIGSGGPTVVDDSLLVWMPTLNDFGDATHKLQIYAARSGGTDIQVDLHDLETATDHMSISSIGGAGFYETTSLAAAMPTSNARFVLRTTTTGGATGTLTAARWHCDENTTDLDRYLTPYIAAHHGTVTGTALPDTAGAWQRVPGLRTMSLQPYGTPATLPAARRLCLYIDVGSAVGLTFRLVHIVHTDHGTGTTFPLTSDLAVGSTGFHETAIWPQNISLHPALQYKTTSGAATYHGYSVIVYHILQF